MLAIIYAGGKSSASIYYRISKTLLVSFFVYRKQSQTILELNLIAHTLLATKSVNLSDTILFSVSDFNNC